MPTPTFERYWADPVTNGWNVDSSTWLDLDHFKTGDCESGRNCHMTLQTSGEIWEFCEDEKMALNQKVPFLISKYRPLSVNAKRL